MNIYHYDDSDSELLVMSICPLGDATGESFDNFIKLYDTEYAQSSIVQLFLWTELTWMRFNSTAVQT